jgi:hypothetical protein
VTDSKIIKLFVDDEPFWLPDANLLSYDRRLNMKSGTTRPRDPLADAGRQTGIDHIPAAVSEVVSAIGCRLVHIKGPIGSRFIGVSLQPAIPRRVAPQQSPLPLHQS